MRGGGPGALKAVYGPGELAALIGIHRSTVWRWIKAGKLGAYRKPLGWHRVNLTDLMEAWPGLLESIAERARIRAALGEDLE